jgi:type II secretory pathway pseudopilin PulG
MRTDARQAGGFTLLEIVVTVGIFATAILAILALLPGLTRRIPARMELETAIRLADAVEIELQRAATEAGFESWVARVAPVESTAATWELLAPRDGSRMASLAEAPASGADTDQYFQIEIRRFSVDGAAADAGAGVALQAQISWPYRAPGAAIPTPAEDRATLRFHLYLPRP